MDVDGRARQMKADGAIEFAGWRDLQVRVRGRRVDLGKIEARLKEFDGVKEGGGVARELAKGGTLLVAYYTLETDESGENEAGAEELRQHLAGSCRSIWSQLRTCDWSNCHHGSRESGSSSLTSPPGRYVRGARV